MAADEPIYKPMRMHTVRRMFKRILSLGAGAVLGITLTVTGARVAAFLNDLLTGHVDYRNELEKALFNCGLTGSGFIKVFWSASAGRPLAWRALPWSFQAAE